MAMEDWQSTDYICYPRESLGWSDIMWNLIISTFQWIWWLRHPAVLGGAAILTVVELADILIGKESRNKRKIDKIDSSKVIVENEESSVVCDVETDCPGKEDETINTDSKNNNLKDISTDAVPELPLESSITDDIKVETVQQSSSFQKQENILRNNKKDAESQTKSRRSRNSRHSFTCRGCGVERERQQLKENQDDFEFDQEPSNKRSMSDTFRNRKKAATIDNTQLVSVHHYIGKLVQVSASSGVMVGDNNCMHMQNSHSEGCLSSEDNVCYQCQQQRMTDDQKSMATQAAFVQTDGPEYQTDEDNQSEDDLMSHSEDEALSPGESPPISPPSSSADTSLSFDTSPVQDGDSSCEVTFSQLQDDDSCDLCPNCLRNTENRNNIPPTLSPDGEDMKQIFVEAKLKIFKATRELRERQSRARRSGQNESFHRSVQGNTGSSTNNNSSNSHPVIGSKVRDSVRKLLAKKKKVPTATLR